MSKSESAAVRLFVLESGIDSPEFLEFCLETAECFGFYSMEFSAIVAEEYGTSL